jgi:hypothetical protein
MKRPAWFYRILVALLVSLGASASAEAGLMAATDGGLAVTIDTASGLEWLDAANTLGDVVSTATADFPQFHLATQSQVESLLVDAGYPAGQLPNGSTSDSTSGNLLASTLGYSLNVWVQYYGPEASGWEYESYAYYLDSASTGVDQLSLDVRNPPIGSDGTYPEFSQLGDGFGTGSSNNFVMLVKVVPEPATFWAFALGGAALGACMKRKRRVK